MEILEIIENIKEGKQEALPNLKLLKDFKKEFDVLLKDVELIALEEANNYENSFDLHGFKFEKRNGKTTYDYKDIEDWVKAKKTLTAIEAKHKNAFSQYKMGVSAVDSETGEIIEMPKVTYSKDVLIVKNK